GVMASGHPSVALAVLFVHAVLPGRLEPQGYCFRPHCSPDLRGLSFLHDLRRGRARHRAAFPLDLLHLRRHIERARARPEPPEAGLVADRDHRPRCWVDRLARPRAPAWRRAVSGRDVVASLPLATHAAGAGRTRGLAALLEE